MLLLLQFSESPLGVGLQSKFYLIVKSVLKKDVIKYLNTVLRLIKVFCVQKKLYLIF